MSTIGEMVRNYSKSSQVVGVVLVQCV